VLALSPSERLVHDEPTRHDGVLDRRESVAIEVAGHEHHVKPRPGQGMLGHIRAEGVQWRPGVARFRQSRPNGVPRHVDAEGLEAGRREDRNVATVSHCKIEGAPRRR
jgi:hypothetical protein